MLTILVAHPVNGHEQEHTERQRKCETNEHVHPDDVEHCKQYQQADESDREVCDVLRLEAFELNRLVNTLVDFVNAGCHQIPKNDRNTVATMTRNTQLPNQAAATLPVSGSPLFHF